MKELSLFNTLSEVPQKLSGLVTCLGMTFENDEARRAYFTEKLRKKLQDPEFRKIEGFPIGSDEDILTLSDPPYYTACPNPWIADFIAEWEAQKLKHPEGDHYHREPFAADVSEGKNDPIYNAHSYHTKVPHKAIMRYILHYTEPGDIVFDGFCGTGMTGVAAQMCGNREVVMSLGYQVKPDGTILQEETDEEGKKVWRAFSKLGIRKVTLNDLSPLASFVASNYNTAIDSTKFKSEAQKVLKEVENECAWMYQTSHTNGLMGDIICIVWSDVFVCPECLHEINYWDAAVDKDNGVINDEFYCKSCNVLISKKSIERAWETVYDDILQYPVKQGKQVPVLIVYKYDGKRFKKKPDDNDFKLLDTIQKKSIPYWFPKKRMPIGKETRRNDPAGITHVHHFYTKRNLYSLSAFVSAIKKSYLFNSLQYQLDSLVIRQSKLTRFLPSYYFHGGGGWVGGPISGTLYIPSLSVEVQPFETWSNRINKTLARVTNSQVSFACSTGSASDTGIPSSSIDYIFLDPPFGSNINYSELSFLWESWLRVCTDNEKEAIENSIQKKGINEYHQLMTECFNEAYRILKPGHWMTVEFSNTKAAVWNSIQTSLTDAGFIVANISALDKKQGSFKAVTTPTAVKQDLVISAYKPNGGFEDRFQKEAQTEEGVWDFVRTHLRYLPITKQEGSLLHFVPERDPRILFDQMVAYYVRKGYPVPLSSHEFQAGLAQRFIERDGMFFLPEQVAEYDRKKMISGEVQQMSMFVSDEASAIQWLRQLIKEKPQTFSDINPQFMQQLGGWSKNESQLDLRELLNQNFLCYDGKGPVPEQIHAYLSTNWKELRNLSKDDPTLVAKARDRWYVPDPRKAGDLEKLREKALLKEFEEYKEAKKKLKVFRLGGSTDHVARYKLGKGLAEAAPYLLLLSATPHQGKTDAFHRLMNLLDEDAFPDMASVSRERVAPYIIRTEKRKAIDADGKSLFKPRRTQMAPVTWESRHHLQQLLYEAVTDYVREGYNQALREKKRHIGFLMLLMQRLVVSSTRAIRTTLERRLTALKESKHQAGMRMAELKNSAEGSESVDDEMVELYDMDGQELLDELLKSRVSALQSEGIYVESLLDAAVRCEQAGPDAKAEALINWIYDLQAEENEPDLKVLIFTEFVPTQQMLKEFLEARGISVVTLNGSMDMEERKQVQEAFSKSYRVLVSTDAGGEGLNLQFAHIIINYDIPWNPMRLEQRIGRVDRIGQPKTVRAINFVFEDSVEFRVREVLEQKLSVIFEEFGIDKTGDVLDSAQAGEMFENVFASAIMNPDGIETSVEHTVARLRNEIQQAHEASVVYDISETPDIQVAERLRSHPLPYWVERMTVGYLNSHGGSAIRKRSWWDLSWPDGQEYHKVVFSAREANRLTDATLLNLENSRVRGLALNLPQVAAGQPLPCVRVSGLPDSISGLWGLFEIRLQAGMHHKTQLLHIPMVRRGYVSVFLSGEGKLFLPTARHIWDALQTADIQVQANLSQDESLVVYERLQTLAEQAGQEKFDALQHAHLVSVAREEERGIISFASRRKAIERVGLPEVRQFRASRCDADEFDWLRALQEARQIVPEIRPLLMLQIIKGGV